MTLERLREMLAREGEAIAAVLTPPGAEEVIAPLVRASAAAREDGEELALVLESILEGYLLHYGRPRLVATDDDDLKLLAGDHMYAVGLARLSRLGDLDAVRALADLITLCARVHADAGVDGAAPNGWPAALWVMSALAVGGGPWEGYERSLEAARAGRAEAADLLAEGRARAAGRGLELEAQAALIAFGRAVADRPDA